MEHNAVINSQYSRREKSELNSVPADITEVFWKKTFPRHCH